VYVEVSVCISVFVCGCYRQPCVVIFPAMSIHAPPSLPPQVVMSKESRKTPRDMLDRERTAPGREQCLLPWLSLCLLSLCQLVVVVVLVIVRLPACCGAAGGALVGVPPARPCGVIACYNLTVLNSSHLCVSCATHLAAFVSKLNLAALTPSPGCASSFRLQVAPQLAPVEGMAIAEGSAAVAVATAAVAMAAVATVTVGGVAAGAAAPAGAAPTADPAAGTGGAAAAATGGGAGAGAAAVALGGGVTSAAAAAVPGRRAALPGQPAAAGAPGAAPLPAAAARARPRASARAPPAAQLAAGEHGCGQQLLCLPARCFLNSSSTPTVPHTCRCSLLPPVCSSRSPARSGSRSPVKRSPTRSRSPSPDAR
jgi:hypothetical protein